MVRASIFGSIALATFVSCAPLMAADPPAVDKPNIVFILIDTLRADHLGCYGYPLPTSPTIDEIASGSIVFTDAVAPAPWTVPSVASVFTSTYPSQHGVLKHKQPPASEEGNYVSNVLDGRFETLAEQLKGSGYATAAFLANAWIDRQFGFAQGFDEYQVIRARGGYAPGSAVNQAAIEWIKQNRNKEPLFIYVHYMDVHEPYNAPAAYRAPFERRVQELMKEQGLTKLTAQSTALNPGRLVDVNRALVGYLEYWIARYDAGIRHCDSHVGELRDGLVEIGLWDDAFVVITADHGQELGEHGGGGHGLSLFAHQLDVPLIIQTPWSLPPARTSATVSLLDLAPTLCDVAGSNPPSDAVGRSLVPMLRDPGAARPNYAFAEGVRYVRDRVSVQLGPRKLIENEKSGERAFFNLKLDPTEQSPIRLPPDTEYTKLTDAMRRWLHQNRSGERAEAPTATIDPELERTLKSLGYLGDDDD